MRDECWNIKSRNTSQALTNVYTSIYIVGYMYILRIYSFTKKSICRYRYIYTYILAIYIYILIHYSVSNPSLRLNQQFSKSLHHASIIQLLVISQIRSFFSLSFHWRISSYIILFIFYTVFLRNIQISYAQTTTDPPRECDCRWHNYGLIVQSNYQFQAMLLRNIEGPDLWDMVIA